MAYVQSQTKYGLGYCENENLMGYTNCSQQPIILSRVLGHHELIFNERKEKSTHFDKNAAGKWTLSSNCWICEKYRYNIIVYNRELASKHYVEVTDTKIIE
jgi:hypothetical protein